MKLALMLMLSLSLFAYVSSSRVRVKRSTEVEDDAIKAQPPCSESEYTSFSDLQYGYVPADNVQLVKRKGAIFRHLTSSEVMSKCEYQSNLDSKVFRGSNTADSYYRSRLGIKAAYGAFSAAASMTASSSEHQSTETTRIDNIQWYKRAQIGRASCRERV